jgi:3-isopropylmalate/(R)-2-methylmalate dehydratase small subunit
LDKIEGLAYILGDDINTDDIIPGHALTIRDSYEMAQFTFEYNDPNFIKSLSKGTILIAGENFGTGSSREEAVNVFKILGIKAIIAKSFARIYFRNLINLGIPGIILNWSQTSFDNDDQLEIFLNEGILFNRTRNLEIKFLKLPQFLIDILAEGGIINRLKKDL